jgi:alpha-D-ribose 1-methylphosphonate 5-triphosphate diphosphatase
MTETVLNNARVVLANEVILASVLLRDGMIAEIGAPISGGDNLDCDYLLPGFVELHTDALEFHYKPRPKVRWSPAAAIQQHDAQVAASGITTVFDALRVGLDQEADMGATT